MSKLQSMNYREIVQCRSCKQCKVSEQACGSQSFMTVFFCKKADTWVSPTGTCDAAKGKK